MIGWSPGPSRRACLVVGAAAAILSIGSFLYFFNKGMTNHYGDGVAHVNIARKVVDSPDDSLWQRYIQIGSPWLPLQTVLMLPLVPSERMWRSGSAGSLVSMISFVIAAVSLYTLALSFYGGSGSCSGVSSVATRAGFAVPSSDEGLVDTGSAYEVQPEGEATNLSRARHGALLAAISTSIFLLNPSGLFMQTTPMSEMVFIASVLTAVCLLQRWVDSQTRGRLISAGAAMTVATLSRYEAWPVAALAILVVVLAARGDFKFRMRSTALFAIVVAAGPIYWLWHNWAIYGNALEFLTGPNSARGIYLQNRANLGWSKIFVGHAMLDAATILTAAAVCAGPLMVLLALGGLVRSLTARHQSMIEWSPALLLLVPSLFHVVSLYRGEIQIFPLSAFGLHNVRYGLLHLPAIALFAPGASLIIGGNLRRWAPALLCAIVVLQYGYLMSEGPSQLAVYQEGYRNGVNARPARELAEASSFLRANPPRGLTLMNTGALGPLVSRGGLRFSELIHEGTVRWHQLNEGIPADVLTVIIENDDPLDKRFQGNAALSRDLAASFREEFSIGKIRLLRRVAGD